MARTDTIEYFQNVASEIQSAEAKDIAREALTVIGELQREVAHARRAGDVKAKGDSDWDGVSFGHD